jgi:hypothetical protein
VHCASTCDRDVSTAEGREASRSRASDSPAPGESGMLEQPGKTKNTGRWITLYVIELQGYSKFDILTF